MSSFRNFFLTLICSAAGTVQAGPDFDREIQPILSENCNFCHGPDKDNREADLRLDDRDAAIASGAIVPGKPAESEMIRRIFSDDPDDLMPTPGSHRKLSDKEKKLLEAWILDGAEYAQHWSFVPLEKPVVPDGKGTEIDRFVRAGLAKESLQMQPEAEPTRLMRRVTFDLTGLPPTLEELDAYLANESPNRYNEWVDELLSRPSYGERMATPWLDASRYADSYGFQRDENREVWAWRDWVIDAFNENLPYDDFLTWQIAGDLLPDATHDQKLATAFCRLHQQENEGGSVEEEYRVEYVADRAQTVATAFMGLTFECARCHDHKYDPISQKDYFGLFAFFNNVNESGLYSYFTTSVPTPTMELPTENQSERRENLQKSVAQKVAKLATVTATEGEKFTAGETANEIADRLAAFTFDKGDDSIATGANERVPGKFGEGLKLTGDDGVFTKSVGNFERSDPFSVGIWIQPATETDRAVVFHRSKAWHDAASRGYELLLVDGNKLRFSLIHFWPGNSISIETTATVPAKDWSHVAITYDGSSSASGMQIYLNGEVAETEVIQDHLTREIVGGTKDEKDDGNFITIGQRMRDRGFKDGVVDELQVFSRQLSPKEVAHLVTPESPLTLDRFAWLATKSDAYAAAIDEVKIARKALNDDAESIRQIMVMEELEEPRQAYLLERGAYDARAEPVDPRVPEALPEFGKQYPENRLGLAQWLTEPDHPLTARVAVNRFWQACFGRGLVGTAEDFGIQGDRPVYPELFDWLSADFVEHGWDMKRLMKQIVTSQVYRQSSFATDSSVMVEDPENRLLARGPRHRLSAEMIRDQALATSGLLVDSVGGEPVNPYEVAESFKPIDPDEGDGLYRRSLYTFWKRTAPAPAMMAFDAVKRDVCAVSRETTSTPLQALVLLNGTQFVEAARILAERAYAQKDPIGWSFRALTSREPGEREREILGRMLEDQKTHFSDQPEAAEAFLKTGAMPRDETLPAPEIAALGVVIEALLSYDETVVKR